MYYFLSTLFLLFNTITLTIPACPQISQKINFKVWNVKAGLMNFNQFFEAPKTKIDLTIFLQKKKHFIQNWSEVNAQSSAELNTIEEKLAFLEVLSEKADPLGIGLKWNLEELKNQETVRKKLNFDFYQTSPKKIKELVTLLYLSTHLDPLNWRAVLGKIKAGSFSDIFTKTFEENLLQHLQQRLILQGFEKTFAELGLLKNSSIAARIKAQSIKLLDVAGFLFFSWLARAPLLPPVDVRAFKRPSIQLLELYYQEGFSNKFQDSALVEYKTIEVVEQLKNAIRLTTLTYFGAVVVSALFNNQSALLGMISFSIKGIWGFFFVPEENYCKWEEENFDSKVALQEDLHSRILGEIYLALPEEQKTIDIEELPNFKELYELAKKSKKIMEYQVTMQTYDPNNFRLCDPKTKMYRER